MTKILRSKFELIGGKKIMTLEEKLERYNELQLQASDIESEMKTLKE